MRYGATYAGLTYFGAISTYKSGCPICELKFVPFYYIFCIYTYSINFHLVWCVVPPSLLVP